MLNDQNQKILFCKIAAHENYKVNYVCLDQKCEEDIFSCSECKLQYHKNHLEQVLELNILLTPTFRINQFQQKLFNLRDEVLKNIDKIQKIVIETLEKVKLNFMKKIEIYDLSKVENIQDLTKQNFITLANLVENKESGINKLNKDIEVCLNQIRKHYKEIQIEEDHKFIGQVIKGGWKDGMGIKYTEDGIYEGEFKNNQENGHGTFYQYKKNERYEGEFKDGKMEGKGIYYFNDGRYIFGNYKNGQAIGTHAKYSADNKYIKYSPYLIYIQRTLIYDKNQLAKSFKYFLGVLQS